MNKTEAVAFAYGLSEAKQIVGAILANYPGKFCEDLYDRVSDALAKRLEREGQTGVEAGEFANAVRHLMSRSLRLVLEDKGSLSTHTHDVAVVERFLANPK